MWFFRVTGECRSHQGVCEADNIAAISDNQGKGEWVGNPRSWSGLSGIADSRGDWLGRSWSPSFHFCYGKSSWCSIHPSSPCPKVESEFLLQLCLQSKKFCKSKSNTYFTDVHLYLNSHNSSSQQVAALPILIMLSLLILKTNVCYFIPLQLRQGAPLALYIYSWISHNP